VLVRTQEDVDRLIAKWKAEFPEAFRQQEIDAAIAKKFGMLVGLIPARAGSERIPGKNVKVLAGHPLVAYTIAAAKASGVFDAVVVSTDAPEIAAVACRYGAEVLGLRPVVYAQADSPDIDWVRHALGLLKQANREAFAFSILRPTSPFRQPETIWRAWREFMANQEVDSLRAIEPCRQHPGKMWVVRGHRMMPLLPLGPAALPWHSMPSQALPRVHVQNASLEIAWSRVVWDTGTIAGETVRPFFTEGHEGFDLNTLEDWAYAEWLIETGRARLPEVG
jgi:N-acylneuraminate cytidylyltransferase